MSISSLIAEGLTTRKLASQSQGGGIEMSLFISSFLRGKIHLKNRAAFLDNFRAQ